MIDDLFYVCFDWMESRFAGRGQARACRWRKQKDEYEKGGVESLD